MPEQYVHRIGRTARAGKDGIAIAFCAEDERAYLKDIRKRTDAEFERLDLPENFRAVVEGVGPTKREPPKPRKRVKPKPAGGGRPQSDGEQRKGPPKRKHPARKGKPQSAGRGRPSGGHRRRRAGR